MVYLLQVATLQTQKLTPFTHGAAPPRVPILVPYCDDLLTSSVTSWEKTVKVQPGKSTIHHHNSN